MRRLTKRALQDDPSEMVYLTLLLIRGKPFKLKFTTALYNIYSICCFNYLYHKLNFINRR